MPLFDGRGRRRSLSSAQEPYAAAILQKLRDGSYALESIDRCPCGSDQWHQVLEGDRFGLPVGVVGCVTCGLLRTSPRLAARCLPDFYADDYHGLHFGISDPDPNLSLFRTGQGRIIYHHVADLLTEPHLRVAEVGAGTGTVLREFAQAAGQDGRTVDAIGCEYSPAFVSAGRSRGTDLRVGGVEALADIPCPDVLILSHVVEHFADIPTELSRIRTITGEATVVYVEVPGVLTIHAKSEYEYMFEQYVTLAHNFHFTLATLADVMNREGFQFIKGDEVVRSVFRQGASAGYVSGRRAATETRYLDTVRYLQALRTSRTLAVRRWALRMRRVVRVPLVAIAHSRLGVRLIDRVRARQRA